MEAEGTGSFVVTDDRGKLVGLVTDRDFVVRGVAQGLDPSTATVGDVATAPVVTLPARNSLEDAAARMGEIGERRLVLVDDVGKVAGLVSPDDVLAALARTLGDLATVARLARHEAGKGEAIR